MLALLVSGLLLSAGQVVSEATSDAELGWRWAMERSVWGMTTSGSLDTYLGAELGDAVRCVGSGSPAVRRLALREWDRHGRDLRWRAVLLGCWHRDVGVRMACLRFLVDKFPCVECEGGWFDAGYSIYQCSSCDGSNMAPVVRAISEAVWNYGD